MATIKKLKPKTKIVDGKRTTIISQPKSGIGSVAETNRLLGGNYFAESGKQLKPFTSSDAKRNAINYVQPDTTVIQAGDIGNIPPVAIPPVITAQDPGSLAMANNLGFGLPMQDGLFVNQPVNTTQDQFTKNFIERMGLQEAPPSTADIYAKERKAAGIAQKEQEVANYTNQLNAITAKAQADQLSLVGQGRGIPEVIIGGQQAQINREAAIAALPVQAQLSAAQGNLEMAQQHLDTMFKLKSQDALAQYQYKSKLIDAVYDFADKQETRRLETLERDNERKFKEKMAKLEFDRQKQLISFKASVENQATGGIGAGSAENMENLAAYGNEYNATGKLPSPTELKAAGLTVGQITSYAKQQPKGAGALVSKNTGVRSSTLSPTQEDGITALYDLTKKLDDLSLLYKQRSILFPTKSNQNYNSLRDEIVDLLARARTGAAITQTELDQYTKKLPLANLGQVNLYPQTKIANLKSSLEGKLKTSLNTNQLSLYGYSKVDVGGVERTVGEIIDVGGQQYRVLPDGTLTDII